MNLALPPHARYMILCDDVLKDPQRAGKLLIVGLTSLVNWPAAATEVSLEKLTVLLILTDGNGRIVCLNEETGVPVFGSPPRPVSFEGKDPSGFYGVTFKLLDVRLPEPGVYVVQFFFNDSLVQEQLLTVR